MSCSSVACVRWVVCVGLAVGLGGCGSSAPAPVEVPELSSSSKPVSVTPIGSLEREEVERTVDAGLGAFLQRLSVEPVVQNDKFVGFRLTRIQDGTIRKGIDVQQGDVVTHANGRSLEGETDTFEIFQSLKTASELRLSVVRNGQPREVVIPIVGDPGIARPSPDAGTPG